MLWTRRVDWQGWLRPRVMDACRSGEERSREVRTVFGSISHLPTYHRTGRYCQSILLIYDPRVHIKR